MEPDTFMRDNIVNHRGVNNSDKSALKQVFEYQTLTIPSAHHTTILKSNFNLPEYFENIFTSREVDLLPTQQSASFIPVIFNGDKIKYAKETIFESGIVGLMLFVSSFTRPSPRYVASMSAQQHSTLFLVLS
jgi:hypothetical protein